MGFEDEIFDEAMKSRYDFKQYRISFPDIDVEIILDSGGDYKTIPANLSEEQIQEIEYYILDYLRVHDGGMIVPQDMPRKIMEIAGAHILTTKHKMKVL